MRLFYKAAYAVGFTPWDRSETIPGEGDQVLELVAEEESGEPPYGRVLDIGCGKGRYSIAVARRGWQVTGVDGVSKAVAIAGERARRAGVDVEFVEGDVTRLPRLTQNTYSVLLDMGCFHGMTDAERRAVVVAEAAVATSGTTLLMVAFHPLRGPGPRGVTKPELVSWYVGWSLTDDWPLDIPGAPKRVRQAAPHLYRLRKE